MDTPTGSEDIRAMRTADAATAVMEANRVWYEACMEDDRVRVLQCQAWDAVRAARAEDADKSVILELRNKLFDVNILRNKSHYAARNALETKKRVYSEFKAVKHEANDYERKLKHE